MVSSTPNTLNANPSYRAFLGPRYWPTWLTAGLLRSLTRLPHPLRLAIGRTLGRIGYRLAKNRRAIAHANIKLCLPHLNSAAQETLIKRHFESLGIALLETGMSWWSSNAELLPLTHIEGMHHLEAAIKNGHGAILLGSHFTPIDLSCRMLAITAPAPVYCVYQRHANPLMDEIIRRNRQRQTSGMIAHDGIRQMVRALRDNGIVWYAPDQAYDGKGAELVPFFGHPATSNTATSRLAKISGAPVLPYFLRRTDKGRYVIMILPALDNFPSEDLIADTRRYHEFIEAQTRLVPEQYLWVHKRFKDRPKELGDVYGQ